MAWIMGVLIWCPEYKKTTMSMESDRKRKIFSGTELLEVNILSREFWWDLLSTKTQCYQSFNSPNIRHNASFFPKGSEHPCIKMDKSKIIHERKSWSTAPTDTDIGVWWTESADYVFVVWRKVNIADSGPFHFRDGTKRAKKGIIPTLNFAPKSDPKHVISNAKKYTLFSIFQCFWHSIHVTYVSCPILKKYPFYVILWSRMIPPCQWPVTPPPGFYAMWFYHTVLLSVFVLIHM